MKRIIATLAAGLTLAALACPASATNVVGHRGDQAAAPESTVEAYQAAVDNGADYLEGDVQFTSDNGMVVLHDYGPNALDRTTSCTGSVQDKTYGQVRACGVMGYWQMLTIARDTGTKVMPELRAEAATPTQAQLFMAHLTKYAVTAGAVVQSANPKTAQWIALRYTTPVALVTYQNYAHPSYLAGLSCEYYAADYQSVTPAQMDLYRERGIKVELYTARTSTDNADILALGPDGVITNDVALTKSLV